ncbi:MAG: hypothetical protein Q9201_006677 [Fulgogasparrea decipioides]
MPFLSSSPSSLSLSSFFRTDQSHTDHGQAGAQGIEDGAAIGILLQSLQSDSPELADKIEQRLKAFETVRHKRASLIQIFSNVGQDEAEKIRDEAMELLGEGHGLKVPANQAEIEDFNFGHDVIAESERVLQGLVHGGTA